MGAQMVREVASKPSDIAVTARRRPPVLPRRIYREGVKNVVVRARNPDGASSAASNRQSSGRRKAQGAKSSGSGNEDLAQVGTISANSDPRIGKIIATPWRKVGKGRRHHG
jgi:chaperonin GroEL